MENINLKINGLEVSAPAGSTILEAAHLAGIRIPTLCYLKEINEIGACRMCVVEVKGAKNLVAAGLADRLEIEVSYAIGKSEPISIYVETFGTGKVSDEEILELFIILFKYCCL